MRSSTYAYDKEKNAFIVKVAMPGIAKDNVVIEAEDVGYLVIRTNAEDNPFNIQPVRFSYTQKIDTANAIADLKEGVLTLILPLEQKRQIAIR